MIEPTGAAAAAPATKRQPCTTPESKTVASGKETGINLRRRGFRLRPGAPEQSLVLAYTWGPGGVSDDK